MCVYLYVLTYVHSSDSLTAVRSADRIVVGGETFRAVLISPKAHPASLHWTEYFWGEDAGAWC